MEEEADIAYNSHHYINLTCIIVAATTGLISDIIIITTIATNKCLHNRTNWILLCYFVFDSGTHLMTTTFYIISSGYAAFTINIWTCAVLESDGMFHYFAVPSMAMLLSDFVVNTKIINNRTLFGGFIFALVLGIIIATTTCVNKHFLDTYTTYQFSLVILLIATVSREVYRCYKAKTNPINEEAKFRLNIVRIYVSMEVLAFVMIVLLRHLEHSLVVLTVDICVMLTSAIMLIYIYKSDRRFKICILNLFRKTENKYNMDAMIGFIDDFGNRDDAEAIVDINVTA